MKTPLLIDAHVHFHSGFSRDAFLDSALENFRRGAAELGLTEPVTGCLMFAEVSGERYFLRWQRREDGVKHGAWDFEPTADPAVLVARRRSDGERLLVLAGRQATTEEFLDGLPFDDALARVRWSGALTVLPWGFGKWTFYREALIEKVVCRTERPGLCLGDNAGRPEIAGLPRLFREAEARGIPVLPGSDPLPLPEHGDRAGAYGFLPSQSLRRTLRALTASPRAYGRLRDLTGFCRDQFALRFRRGAAPVRAVQPVPIERAAAPSSWMR
jgi:hypothetical protein